MLLQKIELCSNPQWMQVGTYFPREALQAERKYFLLEVPRALSTYLLPGAPQAVSMYLLVKPQVKAHEFLRVLSLLSAEVALLKPKWASEG
mmetsp:Transcript_3351/g.6126  ORF Transcript_3351/g.6126 Transcript_3351/m.6126 type:complete len:91 (-) Transcript_3351:634-906(-)